MISAALYFGVIVVNWFANAPEDNVIAYNIFMDGGYVNETSATTYRIENVDLSSRRCIYLTAYNHVGESRPSETSCVGGVSSSSGSSSSGASRIPASPTGLRLVIQ